MNSEFWISGYGLRATGYGLRATGYGLRATENRITSIGIDLIRGIHNSAEPNQSISTVLKR